jgi:outer membrane protein W
MKTTIVRALVAVALLAGSTAQAQVSSYRPDRSLWLVGWGLAQPLGNLADFQSGSGLEGFGMEFRSIVKPRISAGLAFDYNRFERTKSMETFERPGGGAVSAPTYRYADQFGIKVTGHYYLMENDLKPYVGAGVGGNWSYAYLQTADLASTDHDFTIIMTPEVGVLWEVAKGRSSVAINVALRYNFTVANFFGVDNAQWLSEMIGISVAY